MTVSQMSVVKNVCRPNVCQSQMIVSQMSWAKYLLVKCLLAKCLLAKCLLAKCLLAKCLLQLNDCKPNVCQSQLIVSQMSWAKYLLVKCLSDKWFSIKRHFSCLVKVIPVKPNLNWEEILANLYKASTTKLFTAVTNPTCAFALLPTSILA